MSLPGAIDSCWRMSNIDMAVEVSPTVTYIIKNAAKQASSRAAVTVTKCPHHRAEQPFPLQRDFSVYHHRCHLHRLRGRTAGMVSIAMVVGAARCSDR